MNQLATNQQLREFDALRRDLKRATGNAEAAALVAPLYEAAAELGIVDEPRPTEDNRLAIARYALTQTPEAFLFFARNVALYGWIPDEPHTELAEIIMFPYLRKVIYVPRGGLKTTMGGIIQSARDILSDPVDESIEYGMINQAKGGAVGSELLGVLENPIVTHLYGAQRGTPWGPMEFNVAARGRAKDRSFMVGTIEAPLVGKHPRRARVDDLYDDQHRSARHLEDAYRFFQGLFQEADRADSSFDVLMTRWHRFDVYDSIEQLNEQASADRKFLFFLRSDGRYSNEPDNDIGFIRNGVYHLHRPKDEFHFAPPARHSERSEESRSPATPVAGEKDVILSEAKDLAVEQPPTWLSWWPDKYTEDFAREQRRILGNVHYALQYKNRPIDEAMQRFKLEFLRTWTTLPSVARFLLAMDPAYAVNQDSDFTAIVLVLLDPDGKFYIVDGDINRYAGSTERARAAGRVMLRWLPIFTHGIAAVEGYGDITTEMDALKAEVARLWESQVSKALKDQAKENPTVGGQDSPRLGMRFSPVNQSNNPGVKEDRIGGMDGLWEAGALLLPPPGHRIIRQHDGNVYDLHDLLARLFQWFPELPPGQGLWDLGDAVQMTTTLSRPPVADVKAPFVDPYEHPDTHPRSVASNPFVRRKRVTVGAAR